MASGTSVAAADSRTGSTRMALSRRDDDLQPLIPVQSSRGHGIALRERETRDASTRDLQLGGDRGPSRLFYPGTAPGCEVLGRAPIEQNNQIGPGGVGERVVAEVLAQAVAKRLLAKDAFELAHDDRRLLINDRPIQAAGLVQVVQMLPDRIRSSRAIHVVGCRVVRIEEPQLVIDLREGRIDDLRRHEVREYLLHPHVVEPSHGDEIAEPHVRRLVRDHAGAPELLILGRRLIQKEAGRVVEDRAGVFHAAELERGHQQEIELAPRIRDARVPLEPGQ